MREQDNADNNPIIRLATSIMFPLIVLLAFYMQANGEISTGGGFQAGAILASALALYHIVYGIKISLMLGLVRVLSALGVSIYALTGVAGMFKNGAFLDHSNLVGSMVKEFHWYNAKMIGYASRKIIISNQFGIFCVEIGVGLTVFATFSLIILTFMDAYSYSLSKKKKE